MSSSEDESVLSERPEEQQEESWSDWEAEDKQDGESYQCLLSNDVFGDIESCFNQDAKNFGFDLRQWQKIMHLDLYGCIQMINYIRDLRINKKQESSQIVESLNTALDMWKAEDSKGRSVVLPWDDDRFLLPVLAGDAMLHSLDFALDDEEDRLEA
jgi:hypothetical protein